MAEPEFDVSYLDRRNRLTIFFRIILAIPHSILLALWGWVTQVSALLQWLVIVFTGKRNEGLHSFNNAYLEYSARVSGYTGLLHDTWPGFATERRGEPVHYRMDYHQEANRLTTLLRLLWIIPALLVAMVFSIAAAFVQLIAWFVIVITGRLPRGMFDFLLRFTRLSVALSAYMLLLTDEYPLSAWSSTTTGTLPPGNFSNHPAPPASGTPGGPGSGTPGGPGSGTPGGPGSGTPGGGGTWAPPTPPSPPAG